MGGTPLLRSSELDTGKERTVPRCLQNAPENGFSPGILHPNNQSRVKVNLQPLQEGGSVQESRELDDGKGRSIRPANPEIEPSGLELLERCLQEEKVRQISRAFQCPVYL